MHVEWKAHFPREQGLGVGVGLTGPNKKRKKENISVFLSNRIDTTRHDTTRHDTIRYDTIGWDMGYGIE